MIINTIEQFESFIKPLYRTFSVEKITREDVQNWILGPETYRHQSNGFFSIIGIENLETKKEEIMLFQPQHGITGLIISKHNNSEYFLLQARGEPGYINGIQVGPTVQATPANYLKFHHGKSSRYIEYFIQSMPDSEIIDESTQMDFGGKYLYKNKRQIIVELKTMLETTDIYFWIKKSVIIELLKQDFTLNADLLSLLSKYFSLTSVLLTGDTQQVGKLFRDMYLLNTKSSKHKYQLKALHSFDNLNVSDDGVFEKVSHQELSIEFFHVKTTGRENNDWTQPLLRSKSHGLVIMLTYMKDDKRYFKIKMDTEFGLTHKYGIFPSFVAYPGDHSVKELVIKTLSRNSPYHEVSLLKVSDEGGRFYHDYSDYSLIEMSEQPILNLEDHEYWVSKDELSFLLSFSNLCSIQLRVISALIFGLY